MTRRIVLGADDAVRALYSYPNNFNEVGFLEQTLEETIRKYLMSSAERDGLSGSVFKVLEGTGGLELEIEGPAADDYARTLPAYLAAGALGCKGARMSTVRSAGSTIGASFSPMGSR